jgi:predicted nucleotidyltransferase
MAQRGELDLTRQDLAIVQNILDTHVPGRPVFVFGSRVTGRARRRSDLDIAIGGDGPLSLHQESDIREAFDESDLPIAVDVVDLTAAKGIFRERIETEWLPLPSHKDFA